MTTDEIAHVAKLLPELITWMIGTLLFFVTSLISVVVYFAKKRDKQIDSTFEKMSSDLESMQALLKETKTQIDSNMVKSYDKIEKLVSDFQSKAERLSQEIHKLEIGVTVAQEKVALISSIQTDLKDISLRAVRLESSVVSMEKIVENFGKVIIKK